MKNIKKFSALFIAAILVVAFLVPMNVNAEVSYVGRYSIEFDEDTTFFSYYWATLDSTNKTFTLQKNIEFDGSGGLQFVGGSWTLDLNGKTIEATYPITVKDGASLTIVGSGRIQLKDYVSGDYIYGPGIRVMNNSTVTIRGGDIDIRCTSDERDNNPAIDLFQGSTLNIESGNLLLKGAGSGIKAFRSDVNITGGNITLDGSYGFDCYNSNLAISGGNVTVNSESTFPGYVGSATVSGGALNLGSGGNDVTITQTGGIIYDPVSGTVTAKSMTEDYTIPAGATLTVAEGETLTVDNGVTLTVAEGATLINNGIIDFIGTGNLMPNGTFTNNGKIYDYGKEHQHSFVDYYTDLSDGTHQKAHTCYDCPIRYVENTVESHSYNYAGSLLTIREYCSDCSYAEELTMDLTLNKVYNGTAQGGVIEGGAENPEASVYIEYYNDQDEYLGTDAPAAAGTYKTKMTVRYPSNNDMLTVSTELHTYTIALKDVTITSVYAEDKYYDATSVVQIGDYALEGVVDGDDVTVTVAEATVASANAGKYDKVTLSGVTLTGADCGNYTIDATSQVATRNYWDEIKPVEIYTVPVSISALEQTVELNGTPDQSKWEVIDLLEGHKVAAVTLIGDTSRATDFAEVTPADAVVHDAEGNDVTANYDLFYYSAIMIVTCPDHDTFENGFCTYCSGYERPIIDPGEDPEWSFDDVYLISNAGQLLWIAEYVNNVSNEVNVKLMADIIVPAGKTWTPMMNFYGTFDGNLKTVSGLRVKSEAEQVGMFGGGGYSYGTIKNLHLRNSYFEGYDYVGGIAGYHAGTIENCYVDGTVIANSRSGNNEGALVGSLGGGTVTNCCVYNDTLIGYYNSNYGYVTNCYYLSETDDGNGGKTAQQFASGEVAYLLQAGIEPGGYWDENDEWVETEVPLVWGQKIGTDTEPVLGGVQVYLLADGTYSNGEVEKFDIDVARMILGNALEFQFGVATTKIPDKTGYYAIIEKTWADGTTTTETVPASQWGTAGQYWAIVYEGLAAKEMNDTISVTIYNAKGQAISNAREDSVVAYVARAYNSQTATGKTMMVDMLNYGAAAQTHFGYDTENLCNANLTDAQKAVATAAAPEMSNDQVKGTNYQGTRFILQSRIQVQLGFKNLTEDMYAIYSYTSASGTAKEVRIEGADFVESGGTKIGVELSALVYADARALVVVTVYNADGTVHGTASESIESCSARNSGAVFVELMKFADSAKAHLYG